MSLTEDLKERREESRKVIPPDKLAVMDKAAEELARSGILEGILKEGDTVPDFTLPNALGRAVSIAELLDRGPVVVSFYRGSW